MGRWHGGAPATDCNPSEHYNFRCRQAGGGKVDVEVLLATAHRERDILGWVLARVESGMYQQAISGDHTGPYMLTDEGLTRMRPVEPDEDPLCGNEPIIHSAPFQSSHSFRGKIGRLGRWITRTERYGLRSIAMRFWPRREVSAGRGKEYDGIEGRGTVPTKGTRSIFRIKPV